MLSRFSKNYLPILFNLYTDPEGKPGHKSPLMDCIKAYISISGGDEELDNCPLLCLLVWGTSPFTGAMCLCSQFGSLI